MSTKVTSSLKKPLTTYLDEQQPIGTLNNGSVNTTASSGGLSTGLLHVSLPQPEAATVSTSAIASINILKSFFFFITFTPSINLQHRCRYPATGNSE